MSANFWQDTQIKNLSVVPGQTLSLLLRKAGFPNHQLAEALNKKAKILPRRYRLRVGDRYLLVTKKSFHALALYDHYDQKTYFFWRTPKETSSQILNLPYTTKTETVSGKIKGSLIESIVRYAKAEPLAYRFLDAYALHLNPMKKKLKYLKRGDQFSLTYEKLFLGKTFIRNGEVLETSLDFRGKKVQRQFMSFSDGGVFIDPQNSQKEKPFYSPVTYLKISSPFNRRRFHPIKKRRQPHLGVDFELPPGAPIFSAQSGEVIKKGRSRAGGHHVHIDHKNGYISVYNHMRKISSELSKGDQVSSSTFIGEAGCTGYCTKPHLHFGIKKNGKYIDPAPLIRSYPSHYEKNITRKWSSSKKL